MADENDPRPGDSEENLLRKILARLSTLSVGGAATGAQIITALGYTPENSANKDTDGTLAANSDVKYPSQQAAKTYADTKMPKAGGTFSGPVLFGTAVPMSVQAGTNKRAGNATLVAGTVTVANTTVTANTLVFLTRKSTGGTIGLAITYTITAGVGFAITSDSAIDTSTFSYLLIENPA